MPKPSRTKSSPGQPNWETPGRDNGPAILFDLDGTLLDSSYEHVTAWREALRDTGIDIPNARMHRCVGMSGKVMLRAIFTELGQRVSPQKIDHLEKLHKEKFAKKLPFIKVLPGARELLEYRSAAGIRWAIATSGDQKTVKRMIKPLRIPATAPVVTGDHVEHAKPSPDVFLEAAARLGAYLGDCIVVGDSIWDLLAARRAKALGVGLLCGGYGEAELIQAGAYRVYRDPADLLKRIAEIGIQPE